MIHAFEMHYGKLYFEISKWELIPMQAADCTLSKALTGELKLEN